MSMKPASDALTLRLRANWQRRQREALLAALPSDLSDLLAGVPFTTDPDRVAFTQYFVISPAGAGSSPRVKPENYEFFDTGVRNRVVEFLCFRVPALSGGAAVLAFEDDLPCFRVSFEAFANRFADLFDFAKHGLLLVREDLTSGVVVTNYCGYHPEERESDEIVYEVETW